MKNRKSIGDCQFDFDRAYSHLCGVKGVCAAGDGCLKYASAMTALYHAVCLDIDDTITYRNDKEKKYIVDALAGLTERHVIICFITGRGRTSAFAYLNELKRMILQEYPGISESQFRRWHCVTNNGYMLSSHDYVNENGFLSRCKTLVSKPVKETYSRLKPDLQKEIGAYLSAQLSIPQDILMKDSASSIGDNSLRFPIDPGFEPLISQTLIDGIEKIVREKTNLPFGVSRGVYHVTGKIVIEVSMITKGRAIDRFEADLGIPKNKMVRIGDQGDRAGNDFEMLNCQSGFSVGKLSASCDGCWPVIAFDPENGEPRVLHGAEATAHLLNTLKIYPAICLEAPEEATYLPRLAVSEKRNIAANRAAYTYYEEQIKQVFPLDVERFAGIWNLIDEQTGAFYIHDYEYELYRDKYPNHFLFRLYDMKQDIPGKHFPYLKFAMKTDTGLVLRGPMNYYYGLAYRRKSKGDLSKFFALQLNQQRVHFFKACINALSPGIQIDVKDAVTRRALLGIMDSIRDYLLFVINCYLQQRVGSRDALYFFDRESAASAENPDARLHDLFELAKKNLANMYHCLFSEVKEGFAAAFSKHLRKEILPVASDFETFINSLGDDFNYQKGCRVWREIDSFFENIVAVDTAVNKLPGLCSDGREFVFYGMRYGGLELPMIVSMLLEEKYGAGKARVRFGCMCLGSNYAENHSQSASAAREVSLVNHAGQGDEENFHILMDDNLVTGKTLQQAMNLLAEKQLYPDRLVVVRYPSVNRVKHMFLPDHGAPDTDLFWEYVYGLTSPTPYTKLIHPDCYGKKPDNMYLDALGQFNKSRTYVVELLYKNGLYTPDGEVSERGQ